MKNKEQDTSANPLMMHLDEGGLGGHISDDGTVRCVFSTLSRIKVGTGTTTRKHASKLYWFVVQTGEDMFSARRINENNVPAGDEEYITLEELMENYLPEVEFWEAKTIPAVKNLEKLLDKGEAERKDDKLYSAQLSFKKAMTIEKNNVRALFNLGLVYLKMEAMDKARDMMQELLKLKSSFTGKDQHLFNEFGISLRKSRLFDEAVTYYTRALEFIDTDEHLFYNLARVHYERGDWPECVSALIRCRQLNAELKAARDLSRLVRQLAEDPQLCQRHDKPPVPGDLMANIHDLFAPAQEDSPLDIDTSDVLLPEAGRARSQKNHQLDGSTLDFKDIL